MDDLSIQTWDFHRFSIAIFDYHQLRFMANLKYPSTEITRAAAGTAGLDGVHLHLVETHQIHRLLNLTSTYAGCFEPKKKKKHEKSSITRLIVKILMTTTRTKTRTRTTTTTITTTTTTTTTTTKTTTTETITPAPPTPPPPPTTTPTTGART